MLLLNCGKQARCDVPNRERGGLDFAPSTRFSAALAATNRSMVEGNFSPALGGSHFNIRKIGRTS